MNVRYCNTEEEKEKKREEEEEKKLCFLKNEHQVLDSTLRKLKS